MNVLFVEGETDKRFVEQVVSKRWLDLETNEVVQCGDHKRLEHFRNKFLEASDSGGRVGVVFDADDDPTDKRATVQALSKELGVVVGIFLFPDNSNNGTLEDLLLEMVPSDNAEILRCFDGYQECLLKLDRPLTTPNKKARVYAYCEALLPSGSKKMKDSKRDYRNRDLWELNSPALQPFRHFLSTTFSTDIFNAT